MLKVRKKDKIIQTKLAHRHKVSQSGMQLLSGTRCTKKQQHAIQTGCVLQLQTTVATTDGKHFDLVPLGFHRNTFCVYLKHRLRSCLCSCLLPRIRKVALLLWKGQPPNPWDQEVSERWIRGANADRWVGEGHSGLPLCRDYHWTTTL